MVERAVQLVALILRKGCYNQPGRLARWSETLREEMPAVNIRLVRVYGYTLAELLLGFNPSAKWYDFGLVYLVTREDWEAEDLVPEYLLRLYDIHRGERR